MEQSVQQVSFKPELMRMQLVRLCVYKFGYNTKEE